MSHAADDATAPRIRSGLPAGIRVQGPCGGSGMFIGDHMIQGFSGG